MTSTEIKEKFDELVQKRDDAKTQIVQLKTKIESANESIKQIEEEWKNKYGIGSSTEAGELCEKLQSEIEGILDKCEKYLNKVDQ